MSSTASPSTISITCPEIVPVTINQTVLTLSDSPAISRTQRFRYNNTGDGTQPDNKTLELAYNPYEPSCVQVFRNTAAQRYSIDYTVSGNYVILNNALLDSSDEVYVTYISIAGAGFFQAVPVGTIVAAPGSSLTGYLPLVSGTTYSFASYPVLRDWFWGATTPTTKAADDTAFGSNPASNSDYAKRYTILKTYTATTFEFNIIQDVSYDGDTLVTLTKFIKY